MSDSYKYIGDGVYASFDGEQIWLITQRLEGEHRIALDIFTYLSLTEYAKLKFGIHNINVEPKG